MNRALTLLIALLMTAAMLTGCTTTPPVTPTAAPAPAAPAAPAPATAAPAAAAPAAAPSGAGKDTVVVALSADPGSLDPQLRDEAQMRTVDENIFDNLLARDPKTMQLGPSLATSWKNVDATTWEFTLRDGLKFTNGEPLDAEAVAFSVNRIMDPNYKSENVSYFAGIKSAKAKDAKTVQILTDGPDTLVPTQMYYLPIVPPKAAAGPDFWKAPVGSGPYKLVKWDRAQQIVLEANPDYWGDKKPTIKNMIFKIIPDAETRLAALKNNEVNVIKDLPAEYMNQVPVLASGPGPDVMWLRMNSKVGIFTNKDIRQALTYAVNVKGIADVLMGGQVQICPGQFWGPAVFGSNPDLKPYSYDPAKAKELLAKAGYKNEPINFVGANGRWTKDKEIEEAIAQDLQAAGFNVKLQLMPWDRFLDQLFFKSGTAPDLQMSGHSNELFHYDRTLSTMYLSTGPQSAVNDPALDKLINDGRVEINPDRQAALYKQALQSAYDNFYAYPMFNDNNLCGTSKGLSWSTRQDGKILGIEMAWQ